MTITNRNEYRIDCDSCGNCDWVNSKSIDMANIIIKQQRWTMKGKKHFCPDCSHNLNNTSEESKDGS